LGSIRKNISKSSFCNKFLYYCYFTLSCSIGYYKYSGEETSHRVTGCTYSILYRGL